MRTYWQQLDTLLEIPDAFEVLVWSRGRLVTLRILTSSSFSLGEETHGPLGQCVSFSFIDVGIGFNAYILLLFFLFFSVFTQTCRKCKDLENQSAACFLFLIPSSEQIFQTVAMAPAKLRSIWFEAFVALPLWLRIVPVYLDCCAILSVVP